MNYLKYFFFSIGLLTSCSLYAQDRIYKKNGDIIESKIKEINTKSIVYKRFNNADGPDYTTNKTEISKIIFQNGTEEKFESDDVPAAPAATNDPATNPANTTTPGVVAAQETPVAKALYGKNIISLAPLQMSNSSTMGIGVQYERILDKAGIISFYLPAIYASITKEYYNTSKGKNDNAHGQMAWVYPGIKIYPTSNMRRVSYGVGPSLAIGAGNVPVINSTMVSTRVFDPNMGYYYVNATSTSASTVSKFQVGIIINNSINIQPTKNIHIGTELGLGLPYNIDAKGKDDDYNENPIVQFNFNIGYRF